MSDPIMPILITDEATVSMLPDDAYRPKPLNFSATPEAELVREITTLSQKNFSIDTHFYPLGSCTMKYNPRFTHEIALWPGLTQMHPLSHEDDMQGALKLLFDCQSFIAVLTGFPAVCLSPMAGAQGEYAGIAMIRAYHESRGEQRSEMLIPDAAHGTNPASAHQCGYTVRTVPTLPSGDLDLSALHDMLGPQTAGIMLTNPSTLGVMESQMATIAAAVHEVGGLLYYDGANLNAIVGQVCPSDMGFDVMHLNTHKTFATPHGGGGPGAGPIACTAALEPFLPIPRVMRRAHGYGWLRAVDCPLSIGRLSAFSGNAAVLIRTIAYMQRLGIEGLKRVSAYATLNANYLMHRLQETGFDAYCPDRRASHEFVLSLSALREKTGVTATDVAKRLLDYGFHAPTVYFPLIVPECLLIEPTETESKAVLDAFADVMQLILHEAMENPDLLKSAPSRLPYQRLDEVAAARELCVKDPSSV